METSSVQSYMDSGQYTAALHELQQKGVIPPSSCDFIPSGPDHAKRYQCQLRTESASVTSSFQTSKAEAKTEASLSLIRHYMPINTTARLEELEKAVIAIAHRLVVIHQRLDQNEQQLIQLSKQINDAKPK